MRNVLYGAAAAALAAFALPTAASAQHFDAGIRSSLVEPAACRVRFVTVHRPDGRVVHKRIRTCGPAAERCRVKRQLVYRPNGRVVRRTVRVCR